MSVDRLYYSDSMLLEFTTRIIARKNVNGQYAVKLAQTAFYPTSGGQPFDTGKINDCDVMDVWEEGETIWHAVDRMPSEDEVICTVDWGRRFDHMQQHSGQHLLSAAFVNVTRANTISFHLGKEASTIDLDISDLTWDQILQVEKEVNAVIWENRPVKTIVVDHEDIPKIPLRKPAQVQGDIRVIWVDGYDASACGGTHVSQTGQIGIIKVRSIQHYKGGMRVEFLCGKRALFDYHHSVNTLRQASAEFSVHRNELVQAIARNKDDVKTFRRELREARRSLLAEEGRRLWQYAVEVKGVRWIVAHWNDRSFDELKILQNELHGYSRLITLLAVTESKRVRILCFRSEDLLDHDATKILQVVLDQLGGRGGGTPVVAQGGAPTQDADLVLNAMQRAIGPKSGIENFEEVGNDKTGII